MLKTILAISGKPGLYRLISRGRNTLIVEGLKDKRRIPAYAYDKVISLADISMYTENNEVPLGQVLQAIKQKHDGAEVALDIKKATPVELASFMAEALPEYDRDRVHNSDIKKLITWYNLLVQAGETDFRTATEDTAEEGGETSIPETEEYA